MYIFTQSTFKKLLISSPKNGDIYRDYYLSLEEIYDAYIQYQLEYKNIELKLCFETINTQTSKIDNQTDEIKSLKNEIGKLLDYAKDNKEDLKDTKNILSKTFINLDKTSEKLDKTNNKLDKTSKKLKKTNSKLEKTNENLEIAVQRVDVCLTHLSKPNPIPGKRQYYGLVYNETTNTVIFIVGKENYVVSRSNTLIREKGGVILRCTYTSNPHDLKQYIYKNISQIKTDLEIKLKIAKAKKIKKLNQLNYNKEKQIENISNEREVKFILDAYNNEIENYTRLYDDYIDRINTKIEDSPVIKYSTIYMNRYCINRLYGVIDGSIDEQKDIEFDDDLELESDDNSEEE